MPATVWQSELRLTFDPGGLNHVLLDYDDDLAAEFAIDGRQLVQVQPFLRAAAKTFPRQGETHVIEIQRAGVEHSTVAALLDAILGHGLALPRSISATLLIEVRGGGTYQLAHTTVEAWPARQDAETARLDLRLVGGALTGQTGVGTVAALSPAFWFRADQGLLKDINGKVFGAHDQSGNGRHLAYGVDYGIYLPAGGLNSQPAVAHADVVLRCNAFASSIPQPFYIMAVLSVDDNTVDGRILSGNASEFYWRIESGGTNELDAGNDVPSSGWSSAASAWEINADGASSYLYRNGDSSDPEELEGDIGSNALDGFALGGRADSSANTQSLTWSEIVCLRNPVASDITTLRAYIATKYGVTFA